MKSLLNLVGISHAPNAAKVVPLLQDGTPLLLMREPQNPYDPNAIQVYFRLGYIKKEQAQALAKKLDSHDSPLWDAKIARNEGHYAELEIEEPQDWVDQAAKGVLNAPK